MDVSLYDKSGLIRLKYFLRSNTWIDYQAILYM